MYIFLILLFAASSFYALVIMPFAEKIKLDMTIREELWQKGKRDQK